MKASELMLNDWVQHKGSPYRVCMITDIGVVTADDGICRFHFISKYLSPIPLTEDILVKNGFEKDERSKYFHVYTLNIKGSYDFDICWSSVNGFNYEGDFRLAYVHQLQHLLSIAGVEKEIEL